LRKAFKTESCDFSSTRPPRLTARWKRAHLHHF
jgi:hypothetical protein